MLQIREPMENRMTTVDAATADMQRRATAYHEAGHAVMALWHGWEISPEGVEIDEREYTGNRCTIYQHNEEAPRVMILLSGWLSEHNWHRLGPRSASDEDLMDTIDAVRRGDEFEIDCFGDGADALAHLLRLRPDATDAELAALYRRYEAETAEILPDLWPQIERLAAELISLGKIDAARAHAVLGYPPPCLPAP
jgi:hypothetical protein